jgi:hypothetical protein
MVLAWPGPGLAKRLARRLPHSFIMTCLSASSVTYPSIFTSDLNNERITLTHLFQVKEQEQENQQSGPYTTPSQRSATAFAIALDTRNQANHAFSNLLHLFTDCASSTAAYL